MLTALKAPLICIADPVTSHVAVAKSHLGMGLEQWVASARSFALLAALGPLIILMWVLRCRGRVVLGYFVEPCWAIPRCARDAFGHFVRSMKLPWQRSAFSTVNAQSTLSQRYSQHYSQRSKTIVKIRVSV